MKRATPWTRSPATIAGAVVLLHLVGLAALQSGLLVRAYELVVPVEMISQIIEPAQPQMAPPPPPAPAPPPPNPAQAKQTFLPPAPQPVAINDPTPALNATVAAPAPPAALPPIAAPVAAAPTPSPVNAPAAPPAPKLELPRSDADYLNNPAPPYPPVSRRMGEQGRVMVRACVDEKGQPQKAELSKSSGFERLDSAAVATVMRWRFKPGTRNGLPEPGCVGIPVDFKLD